jgi:hypothetical protein
VDPSKKTTELGNKEKTRENKGGNGGANMSFCSIFLAQSVNSFIQLYII